MLLSPRELGIRTAGLVIVPGFVGFPSTERLSLLGRGSSDLTALFLAHHLGVERCILLKDVDGLYEADPKLGMHPRRFDELSLEAAAACVSLAIQPKALVAPSQASRLLDDLLYRKVRVVIALCSVKHYARCEQRRELLALKRPVRNASLQSFLPPTV